MTVTLKEPQTFGGYYFPAGAYSNEKDIRRATRGKKGWRWFAAKINKHAKECAAIVVEEKSDSGKGGSK